MSEAETRFHWERLCSPLVNGKPVAPQSQVHDPEVAERKEQWNKVFKTRSLSHMWSVADAGHVHAISGALYMVLGLAQLLDVSGQVIFGWEAHVPVALATATLFVGAGNAASGMQSALLAKSAEDLFQILGLGPNGNLKSGGFVNTCVFFFILSYQAVRVLPSFPASLQPLDSLIGLLAFLATTHTAAILNGWVNKQAVHRVDTVFLPPLVNLPVAWHLLMDGQTWVEELSARYPGWPEAFFMSNCTLAWSASMVTFVLSLHERRVVSLEMRNGIMLGFPFIVFAIICARVGSLIPEWFQDDVWTIFTLSAPGN